MPELNMITNVLPEKRISSIQVYRQIIRNNFFRCIMNTFIRQKVTERLKTTDESIFLN